MEHEVRDTELTVPTSGRTPVRGTSCREKMRRQKLSGCNGKCVVRRVSKEEMEKLWK